MKPIIIACFSHKGCSSKSTLINALYTYLIKTKAYKRKDIAIINSAPVTDSIIHIFATQKKTVLLKKLTNEELSSEQFQGEIENVQNTLDKFIVSCSKNQVSDILVKCANPDVKTGGLTLSPPLLKRSVYLVDFDGGSLDESDIRKLSEYVQLWIIPCQPGASSSISNDSIIKLLVDNNVPGKNVVQFISQTRPGYSELTLIEARDCIKRWSTLVINMVGSEVMFYKDVDKQPIWCGKSNEAYNNREVFDKLLTFIESKHSALNR